MKKITPSFAAGVLTGALLFSGVAAYAAGVMAEHSSNRVFVDGHEVQIEAYNIGGNNYCKLRDIGKAVDFSVSYDAAENAVRINNRRAIRRRSLGSGVTGGTPPDQRQQVCPADRRPNPLRRRNTLRG